MEKIILGVDNGTNSIGWSIVKYDNEASENKCRYKSGFICQ